MEESLFGDVSIVYIIASTILIWSMQWSQPLEILIKTI